MGLTANAICNGLDALGAAHPRVAAAVRQAGYPEPRMRERGYQTLLRTIVGQQVSVAAAASVWRKLKAELGTPVRPETLLARDFATLRACGLSRQKQGYARSLSELVASEELDLMSLPQDDEKAIAELTRIKGIGRWSAEIYLLFAEGRPDIWPAGDLAVRAGLAKILALNERPDEQATREMAEQWRPHRSALAIFTWHVYNNPAI